MEGSVDWSVEPFKLQPNLLNIELVSTGVYTWMEDVTFKHHFRNISVRIVLRDQHLKSEQGCNDLKVVFTVIIVNYNAPEDALLVRALSDEENTEPEEGGVG